MLMIILKSQILTGSPTLSQQNWPTPDNCERTTFQFNMPCWVQYVLWLFLRTAVGSMSAVVQNEKKIDY